MAPATDCCELADRAARIIADLRAQAAAMPGGGRVLQESLTWLDDYRAACGASVAGRVIGAEVRRVEVAT